MKIVKLLVLLFCVIVVKSYRSGYCEICRNHTLCKYTVGGPSAECKSFDKVALLADGDIVKIINRINARRNLVATGRLARFPQAANMRKVRWSTELASFAQRWADQCDPSVRPNKEDACRDLVGMQVGQSIASVLGPAPGLTVKSFVDMWFMLKLHYQGSIVYYNQSRDAKTNYFTQLIWADTEYVGCGKVKFVNKAMNTVVERFVCNFAPKGNNHGKPVYALGYPATQCPKFTSPDNEFPGLCKQDQETATEIVQGSSVGSLLRILDLSNNSAKQELDPNNLKQINLNSSEINDHRSQKTRHLYLNNSYGAIKRDSFHVQYPLNPISDPEIYKGHQFTPQRGHSRMYHGYQTKNEPIQNFQSTQASSFAEPSFRRYDTTTAYSFSNHDHDHAPNGRRIMNNNNNQYEFSPNGRRNDYVVPVVPNTHHCTRKAKLGEVNCFHSHCGAKQCTRGQPHSCNAQPCSSCLQPPPLSPALPPPLPLSLPPPLPPPFLPPLPPVLPPPPLLPVVPNHDLCPCNAPCTLHAPCDFAANCPVFPSHNCPKPVPLPFWAKRRAQGDSQYTSQTTQFNYYDLFPNVGVRSGENSSEQKDFENPEIDENLENTPKVSEIINQVKDIAGNLKTSFRRPQDSYGVLYSSKRKKRDFEDPMTFKPFWQVDEYNYKRPAELKSLRYTTLRNRKTRKTTLTKLPTESITIKLEDEIVHNEHHKEHVTEKYLSFEELMHLRKLSTLESLDYEARRLGDEALRAPAAKVNPAAAKPAAAKPAAAKPVAAKPVAAKPVAAKPVAAKPVAAKPAAAKPAVTKPAAAKPAAAKPAATTKAATTTTKATTKETTITANTPFIRLKHCTRKLTCTWTAMMMTRPDGRPIGFDGGAGGGMAEFGSRTPPGYVDGCTRTSTCTRDFMDRNKMATSSDNDSTEGSGTEPEDEEYCERRSLKVQRRNLDDTDKILSIKFHDALTEMTPSTSEISHVTNIEISDPEIPLSKHSDCICYEDYSRVKRGENNKYDQLLSKGCSNIKEDKNTKSQDTYYDDLYYSMLRKISKSSKLYKIPHQCPCNGTKSIQHTFYLIAMLKNAWTCYSVFMSNCNI